MREKFIQLVDSSFRNAAAFFAASEAADSHAINSADNLAGPALGEILLAALQQVRADRDAIIDSGRALAATLQLPLSADVLKIVAQFELELPPNAPAKIRDSWPKVKAALGAVDLSPKAADSTISDAPRLTTNDLMVAKITEDPQRKLLTATQWGELIGRSASTVKETPVWKALQGLRGTAKAERLEAKSDRDLGSGRPR